MRRKRRRRKQIIRRSIVAIFFIVLIVIVLLIINSNKLLSKVTVEAGAGTISVESFLKDKSDSGEFVTDISKLDLTDPGKYKIEIKVKNRTYKSNLIIEDTVAPEATAVDCNAWKDEPLNAESFVKDIVDVTDVEVSFKKEPDFGKVGNFSVVIILKDEGENETEIEASLSIVADEEAPVLSGAANITVFIGETVKYKENVIVSDNKDTDLEIAIDNSKVNMTKVGEYEVVYSVTDKAGNVTEKKIKLIVKEKPSTYVDEDTVYELADKVLEKIINDSMTKKEKVQAIYKWIKDDGNIVYSALSDKSSWTTGAYQGFTTGTGDCFVFFGVAKALLIRADIDNIDVVKSDTSEAQHFWNLVNCGDGWYHFDTTPRKGTGDDFCMVTDAFLESYSVSHNNSHIYDKTLYPATPLE